MSSNGMRLDCLTPLASSVFDILGVSKQAVMHIAEVAKAEGLTSLADVGSMIACYCRVVQYQVSLTSLKHLLSLVSFSKVQPVMLVFGSHWNPCQLNS